MSAWLIGLPLIVGAAALAPFAARRWHRGVIVLTAIGVLLLAGAVVLLLVAATAGPAARAAINSTTAPTMSRAPIPASRYIPDRPRRVTTCASRTAPAISGNPATHTAVT